jgi:2-(1,2-epoxy-1,2-dihydrophenyl)acetyl-CoA isomerase
LPDNTKLVVTLEDRIKRITFNRPERRNALDFEMFEQLAAAIKESVKDESRVVVLAGAGDSFCSGLDLTSIDPAAIATLDVAKAVRELINPAIEGLRSLAKPVIARVHGSAVGIGFSYVLASDFCVASEASLFSQSFVRIGLMPDGGSTYFLPRLVGRARAFELMALGEQFDAREALRLGLINRVVPFEELDRAVDQLAARFVASPALSLAKIKAALYRAEASDLAGALDFEAEGQQACFRTADFREGVTAFMQKRSAVFGKKS